MKNLIVFVFVALLTLIFFDFFLKQVKITPPVLKYYSTEFGSLNRPNIDYFKSIQGLFLGRSNYDGRFREAYQKRKRTPRVLRILLIGDSFVEGIDVLSRNHFAQYMEDTLKQILHTDVEILNFGRGNCVLHASAYYFINYISKAYDADLVLYFTEFRDVLPTAYYPSTSFKLDETGKHLIGDRSWERSPEYLFHKRLIQFPVLKQYEDIAVCRLAYRAWSGILSRGFWSMTLGKFYKQPVEQDYSYEKYDVPMSDLSSKLYDSIMSFDKGQVIFVVRNMPIDASLLKGFFADRKYPFIDLDNVFDKQMIRGTNVNAYYFRSTQSYGGHWNHEGHKAVGAYLSNFIARNIKTYKTPHYSNE